jgi:prepilin-type N-terminal cleavage/methylation domain-containing protein
MNRQIFSRKPQAAAFTLIELLTVIAIIAVLMGLLFPALSGAKEQARRADAGVALRNIVAACKSYQTDYGKFPPVATATDSSGISSYGDKNEGKCKDNNSTLFDILRSINRGANVDYKMNKRQSKYIEGKVANDKKNPRNGFCDGSDFQAYAGQYMDPWGAQYCIVLDAADNGTIDMSGFYSDLTAANPIRVSAAGFSMGKDNQRGGKGYRGQLRKPNSSEAPDDIVSWQ